MPLHESKFGAPGATLAIVPGRGHARRAGADPQRDWSNQQPARYPDPDIVALDKSFAKYQLFNAVIYRHYVGHEMGGRAGVVRAGAVPAVERHPQQPADADRWKRTVTSAFSAARRATATATRSISKGGSCRASMPDGAWCATSTMAA